MNRRLPLSLLAPLVISLAGTRCPAQQSSPRTIQEVSVEIPGAADSGADLQKIAEALIMLDEGDRFSPRLLEDSVTALERSGRFREIFVDSRDTEGGVTLLFSLTPFDLVEDIVVTGAFPLLDREVLNVMSLRVSGRFTPGELGRQPALIAALFRREGFVDPGVSVTADRNPKNGNTTVRVKVQKGDHYRIGELRFEGNRAFSSQSLKWRMKSWRDSYRIGSAGRFVDLQFAADIENLVTLYRKKGFADAAVTHEVDRDPVLGTVSARVRIEEGALYVFAFEGNRKIATRVLRKDIAVHKEGNRFERGLKRSLDGMMERYAAEGFQEASVGLVSRAEPRDGGTARSITFVVDEGPKSTVRSLRISGNKEFGDRQIKKLMQTRPRGPFRPGGYAESRLRKDVVAIESLYKANGFVDARVSRRLVTHGASSEVTVHVRIEENTRPLVAGVRITGLPPGSEQRAYRAISMKEGKPFRTSLLKTDENSLSALFAEMGYPHVSVEGAAAPGRNGESTFVEYVVHAGTRVTAGETFFTGNFRTREKVLRRELELEPGDPFSPSRLLKEQQNLRRMGNFDSVRFVPIGLAEGWEKVNLFVEIEEKKPYYLELGVGYDSEQGLYANTTAGDRNVFGRNLSGWVGADLSQSGYLIQTGVLEPRLFGLPVATNLTAFMERRTEPQQTFGTQTLGAALGFGIKNPRALSSGLTFRYERRSQFVVDSAETVPTLTLPRSIFTATSAVVYDTRDSFLYPHRGLYSLLSADFSKGIENSFDDFVKIQTAQRLYFGISKPLTLAFAARAGTILPYGPYGTVPKDQLFYLGGLADVRGFKSNLLFFDPEGNPVGGKIAVSGSVELRLNLLRNFETTVFYDTGCLGNDFGDLTLTRFRSSTGAGLQYRTPVGPVGVFYGVNLDPLEGEIPGVLHFSIGYAF